MEKIVKTIGDLSLLIDKHRFFRWIILLVVTLITIVIHGYHFGSLDHASHIPFLKQLADPSLYPNDQFFLLQETHYSFFWYFFIPIVKVNLLEISVFMIFILSNFLTFIGIWNLSKTLFSNSRISLLAVLLFMVPRIGFAGFSFIEFSLVNRVFAFPFLLFAINYYVQKKYILAFSLLGVFYNIHVLWVQFVLGMFMTDIFFRRKMFSLRKVASYAVCFGLLASPIFLWKIQHPSPILTVEREWYSALERGLLGINFLLFSKVEPFWIATFSGISAIGLFFVSFLYGPKRALDSIIQHFLVGIVFMMIIGVLAYKLYPVTILVQFQLVRVGYFALLFGVLYVSRTIFLFLSDTKRPNVQKKLLLMSSFLGVSPFPLVLHTFVAKKSKNNYLHMVFFMLSGLLFLITVVSAVTLGKWSPGIFIYPPRSASLDVQLWANKHTNKTDMFLAPPYLWWLFDPEWRVYSERSTVVVWSELLEVAFDPRAYERFKKSFSMVAPGALESFRGNNVENKLIVKKAYESLTPEQIIKIQHLYNVRYVVTEVGSYPFPVVYKNERFYVYELP